MEKPPARRIGHLVALATSLGLLSLGALAGGCSSERLASTADDRGPSPSIGASGERPSGTGATGPAGGGSGAPGSSGAGSASSPSGSPAADPAPSPAGAMAGGTSTGTGVDPGGAGPLPQGGRLTAGSWDDNLNFDFYRRYHERMTSESGGSLPQAAIADRLQVLVTDAAGQPLPGAAVSIASGQRELARTQTGADGRALFFPTWGGASAGTALEVVAEAAGVRKSTTVNPGAALVTLPLGPGGAAVTGLDAAIVIDTTGSMGDEIRYLEAELINIADAVRERFPGVSQRWAFVAYRDYQDDYVTRKFDFSTDLQAFRDNFAMLNAAGGGDYEEAPERGLADMNGLGWRDGAVARVAFWVGDAPQHTQHAQDVLDAVRAAKARGIHLYPVSASGTNEPLEFSMRLAALLTGGRYLFLTNDSGVGGDHKEPTIPCYLVTTLQKQMLRMIQMELTGTHIDPAPQEVLRTGGNPRSGRCTLSDGQAVEVL